MNHPTETAVLANEQTGAVKTLASSTGVGCASNERVQETLAQLSKTFAQPFALVNVESGDLVYSEHEGLVCDFYDRVELLAEVSRRGKPELVEEVAPLCMLAIPLR